jgi:malate dehydrogenase (oxaloacetate-decarboxylating)
LDKFRKERSLRLRRLYRGMLGSESKVPARDRLGLSMIYTPGVAEACKVIAGNPDEAYRYTSKGESVALVSNGAEVIDLGKIGPLAALPILEGEAAILSELGGLCAYPICVDSEKEKDFRFVLECIAPSFGAIAVFGTGKEFYENMVDGLGISIPIVRYEEILDQAFRRRGGVTTRQKFCDSYMVMPGLLNALIAAAASEVPAVITYAATREIDDAIKSVGGYSTAALDFSMAERVARACADAFNATGTGRKKVDVEALAERVHRFAYEGAEANVEFPGGSYDDEHLMQAALDLYLRHRGSNRTRARMKVIDRDSIDIIGGNGAIFAAQEIAADAEKVYEYTAKGNTIAVISDGSAVLGLGDIGGLAGLPVMEGKCVLFKSLAGVNGHPLVLATKDADDIGRLVKLIAPTYGGLNLEDISAPKCFELERRLKETVDIPVFHDDQHGTAAVVLAGLINALKLTGREAADTTVAMNGAGAAGITVARMLVKYGFRDVVLCDKSGAIYEGRKENMNAEKEEIAKITNKQRVTGGLAEAMKGRDVFVGVSAGRCVTREMVAGMAAKAIVFALANPVPEIMPEEAKAGGAEIIATGRSDFPNQVNNALIFPGIMRGALGARAKDINEEMKLAAAKALAGSVPPSELSPCHILPSALDLGVAPCVAAASARAAIGSGAAPTGGDPQEIFNATAAFMYENLDRVKELPVEQAAEAGPETGKQEE